MDRKIVLGIDTSARTCTCALVSDRTLASYQLTDGPTHSQSLLPAIKNLFCEANVSFSDLSAIAVSVGPGSFTGLRIGLSTVKGLAFPDNIPCVAVSTLEALATNALEFEGYTVVPVMDARRGEYYNALFRVEKKSLLRVTPDRAIKGTDLALELSSCKKILVLGDGAEKFIRENDFAESVLAPVELRFQNGESVAKIGKKTLEKNITLSCTELAPVYLRLPQAEREWLEKNKT